MNVVKTKVTAGIVAALLVLVPLSALFTMAAVVSGTAIGVVAPFNDLPVNCKAPLNIFDAWDSFEDFVTGVDCEAANCEVASSGGEGGNPELEANRAEYVKNIIGVGNAMNIPQKGIEIALATSLVESGIKNYANDGIYDTGRNPADRTLGAAAPRILEFVKQSNAFPHDAVGSDATSVGMFQQQAWWGTMGNSNWENDPEGTIKRLMDPTFQAQKFYTSLLRVPMWLSMPHGQAAQRVQVSAFPDAYAGRVAEAQALYAKYSADALEVQLYDFGEDFKEGGAEEGSSDNSSGGCGSSFSGPTTTGVVLEKSSVYQVTAQFSQPRGSGLGGPHRGMDIDCGNDWEDVFTPISGVVTIATNGNPSGYGNPLGEVMIKTGDGTIIQLGHMRKVFVKPGATVEGGQAVGECASTGNSTGTHLHMTAYVQDSKNPQIKALPKSSHNFTWEKSENLRDPALVLEILGVDICPPYTKNRKTVAPGTDLPNWPYACWPPKEWTK